MATETENSDSASAGTAPLQASPVAESRPGPTSLSLFLNLGLPVGLVLLLYRNTFVELVNISDQIIDLRGAELTQVVTEDDEEGVSFRFSDGAVMTLAAGQRVVVVEDLDAFQARYGNQAQVAGQWSGRLSNSDELITLSAFGSVIQQFRYHDDWYPATDGQGATLQIRDAAFADLDFWNQREAWQPSAQTGGSPGSADRLAGDANLDGRFNSSDLVKVFQAGKYEDSIFQNASWEEGDWNGDGDFDSQDLVMAFQLGWYEQDE